MPLEAGTKLGPYAIVATIASGPDGEVYKASDTRLNRAVAIRMLPAEFATNSQIRQRLEREARTIAGLNHPHICTLYDVGEQDGTNYLVTEHVEGETLAQRFTRGPMELDESLKTAIAIADALDKAHRGGVTHRGLNPSNVMLTASGVKLMDFGLAKPESSSGIGAAVSGLSTRTSSKPLMTISPTGAAYTAPEQWAGLEGDARTDIFAAGAILYEMLTGTPAFEGKTPPMLVAAIQTIDPDPVSQKQPMAPPALDYIVKRCLAKDPKQRLQTAWDLLTQLQWIAAGGSQVGVPALVSARRNKRERLIWIALAAAAVLVLAMAPATYRYLKGAPEPEDARFIVTSLGGTGTVVGPPPAISPDGRWIIRSTGGTNRGVNAVRLDSVTMQLALKDNVIVQPFWSADNKSVAFFEDGKLKAAEIAGGPAKTICEAPSPITVGTWSRDGVILYSSGGVIYRVLAAGGEPTAISTPDKSTESEHITPVFLPDGRHYLYLGIGAKPEDSAIYVGDIEVKGKGTKLFASKSRAVYADPGYVLFNREGTIYAHAFNAAKLALEGEPIRIADGVPNVSGSNLTSTNLSGTASFGVSQTGVLIYRIGNGAGNAPQTSSNPVIDRTLTWIDRAGARIGQVGGPGAYAGVDLSRDDKRVAVHVHEAAGGDSWFFDSDQGRMQRLTFDATQDNSMPIWSPDGARFAFASKRGNKWGLYVKLADGTSKEELIAESDIPKSPMSWTPDGKVLVYETNAPQGDDIWYVPVTGDKKPVPFLQTPANERFPQLSPDGKWIAYQSNETGRAETYIKPFPEGPGKWQISTDGGSSPRWRADGKELFFVLAPNMNAVDIKASGASIVAGAPRVLFGIANDPTSTHPTDYMFYAVSGDGKRFLIPQLGGGATPTAAGGLAEQLAAAADQGVSPGANGGVGGAGNNMMVVVNWPRLLKRK